MYGVRYVRCWYVAVTKRLDIQIRVVSNAFLPLTSYHISSGIDAFIVGVDETAIFIVGVVKDIGVCSRTGTAD